MAAICLVSVGAQLTRVDSRPSEEVAGPRLDESGATAQVAGVDEDPEEHDGEGEGQSEGEEEETGDECVGTERDDAMEAAGRERVSGEQGERVQKVEQESSVLAREGGGGGGGGSSARRSGVKVPPAPSAATQATPASARAGGSSGAALRPACGGAGKGSGAGEPVGLGVDWDDRGPGFGDKSGKGCNGFRLVFPFDDASCRCVGLPDLCLCVDVPVCICTSPCAGVRASLSLSRARASSVPFCGLLLCLCTLLPPCCPFRRPCFIQPSIGLIGRMYCQGHSQNRSVRRQQPFNVVPLKTACLDLRCAGRQRLPHAREARKATLTSSL